MSAPQPAGEIWYDFSPFRVDPQLAQLFRDGHPVPLPPKVFETLLVLVQSPGRMLTREVLIARLWPDTAVTDTSLTQNIWLLRKALGDDQEAARYIETIPRRGYRFVAPVAVVPAMPPSNVVPIHPPLAEVPAPRRRWGLILAAAALILVAVIGTMFWAARSRREAAASRFREQVGAVGRRPALVAVAFRNETRDPGAAWLRNAIPRMIAEEIASGERLRALPGEAGSQMADDLGLPESDGFSPATLQRIRRYSGADVILAGSVVALPTSLRFTARVQDVASGETIARASAAGREDELFDLVRQAGADLRHELGLDAVAAADGEAVRPPSPRSVQAAGLYARGMEALQRYDLLQARALFLDAEKADPSFARTHRALADVWTRLGYDKRALSEAQLAVERMKGLPRSEQLQIEASLAVASRDWNKAIELRQSLWRFYPDNADFALDLVAALSGGGRSKDAFAILDELRAHSPRPDDPRIDFGEAALYTRTGDLQRALLASRKAAEKAQRAGVRILFARARGVEGDTLQLLEEPGWRAPVEECIAVSRQARYSIGEVRCLFTLANGLGKEKKYAEALRAIDGANRLATTIGDHRAQSASFINGAIILGRMGRYDESLATISRALPIVREIGDRLNEAIILSNMTQIFFELGRLPEARQKAEEALAAHQAVGHKSGIAIALTNLATIERTSGDLDAAERRAGEAMTAAKSTGSKPLVSDVEKVLARVAFDRGRAADAPADDDPSGYFPRFSERVQAAVTARDPSQLEALVGEARSRQAFAAELDARLALAQTEKALGRPTWRNGAQELARDAAARGFARIAKRATAL